MCAQRAIPFAIICGHGLHHAPYTCVSEYTSANGFTETKFADDLRCDQKKRTPDGDIVAELKAQQNHIHRWGATNRVEFDPGKEELLIIYPQFHLECRSIVWALIDCKPVMDAEWPQCSQGTTQDKGQGVHDAKLMCGHCLTLNAIYHANN